MIKYLVSEEAQVSIGQKKNLRYNKLKDLRLYHLYGRYHHVLQCIRYIIMTMISLIIHYMAQMIFIAILLYNEIFGVLIGLVRYSCNFTTIKNLENSIDKTCGKL